LGHAENRSVLRYQLLVVSLGPLNDEDCLCQIRWVDDRELGIHRRGDQNEQQGCRDDSISHGLVPPRWATTLS
jgi:hypothetical protein